MSAPHYLQQRTAMVQLQLKARGIYYQPVIDAFLKVERHRFVPFRLREHAYEDHPLPIGLDQTISQPYIVAYMIQALAPHTSLRVLEIGTGSGYQTALLACVYQQVYSVEFFAPLARRARRICASMGYTNISIRNSDGYKGWSQHAPYDAIIVSCAPTALPPILCAQLAEGGKMIIPLADKYTQRLVIVEKINGVLTQTSTLPVLFVPMLHAHIPSL